MITRKLETKDTLRAGVARATRIDSENNCLLLRTTAVIGGKAELTSADPDMARAGKQLLGQRREGRLRIDVLADDVLRIRYAEGERVPDNQTPMVVGQLEAPGFCDIADGQRESAAAAKAPWLVQADEGSLAHQLYTIRTPCFHAEVFAEPFRIELRDLHGRMICGIGGPEKDFFGNWDAYNTGLCRDGDGNAIATETFDLAADECIYGLGEKFIKLNKVGQTIDLNMADALGVTTPRSYKNVPFFVSTHGYGVFFNHHSLMTCWIGSMSAADVQVAAEDDFLDYYIFLGPIRHVLSRYTDLTGKPTLPPLWTFGYWQSKISYKSAEETLAIAREMRRHEVPCDVIHLDTHWFKQDWYCDLEFDPQRFPDPAGYLKCLADLGIKVSLWQLPYIPEGSRLFNELKAVDGFVKNQKGEIYNLGLCFTPGFKGIVGIIDYSNPAAVRVHQEHFRRLFRLGAKVIKTDFGEAAPVDGVYHDGTPGRKMHNLYPLLYNKAVYEVTREETGDGVVWARSAWAGSQRYPLHWGGDNSPNYHNLIPQLDGGLSFGLSGFPFWSQDIGGFCGTTNDRLLIRWMQLGMFLSHSRIHGFGDRELYKFSPQTLRICRDFIRLRYRLMPYIYGQAKKCVEQSLPLARAMVIEYQDDPTTWNLSDQFFFGESILVAPIYREDNRRRVYLPGGIWTDWWTQQRHEGGRWIEAEAPLDRLPLFVRAGAMIPLGPELNYVDEKPLDRVELLLTPFENDGQRDLEILLDGRWQRIEYAARGGEHVVRGAEPERFALRMLGHPAANVRFFP